MLSGEELALRRRAGWGCWVRCLLEPAWGGKIALQLHCCDLMALVFYFKIQLNTSVPKVYPDPKVYFSGEMPNKPWSVYTVY